MASGYMSIMFLITVLSVTVKLQGKKLRSRDLKTARNSATCTMCLSIHLWQSGSRLYWVSFVRGISLFNAMHSSSAVIVWRLHFTNACSGIGYTVYIHRLAMESYIVLLYRSPWSSRGQEYGITLYEEATRKLYDFRAQILVAFS